MSGIEEAARVMLELVKNPGPDVRDKPNVDLFPGGHTNPEYSRQKAEYDNDMRFYKAHVDMVKRTMDKGEQV